jgi:hypothetical protein
MELSPMGDGPEAFEHRLKQKPECLIAVEALDREQLDMPVEWELLHPH